MNVTIAILLLFSDGQFVTRVHSVHPDRPGCQERLKRDLSHPSNADLDQTLTGHCVKLGASTLIMRKRGKPTILNPLVNFK